MVRPSYSPSFSKITAAARNARPSCRQVRRYRRQLSASISHQQDDDATVSSRQQQQQQQPHNNSRISSIGIVGGGLAGLSTAFHLLEKTSNISITILDKAAVGTGGASSVAGGLLHPLSPRGKVIHGGLEGLEATRCLVEHASRFKPQCVLRNKLYRVALTQSHVEQLKTTATQPEFANVTTWMSQEDMQNICHSPYVMGGLELSDNGGCLVLDVPSYLEGLWMACLNLAKTRRSTIEWKLVDHHTNTTTNWKKDVQQQDYDVLVLAAGAGLFHDAIVHPDDNFATRMNLVRGQSIEMSVCSEVEEDANSNNHVPHEALLCGKYIIPLPSKDDGGNNSRRRLLLGATHEYSSEQSLNQSELVDELRSRLYKLAPNMWSEQYGHSVDRITSGWRVQSRRSARGRLPIVEKLDNASSHTVADLQHSNVWIFTGLSSRGLLYHGVYGDLLTDVILGKGPKIGGDNRQT